MLSLTSCTPVRLHPFSKDTLATVLMSKPFGNRPSFVAHFPHALHVHMSSSKALIRHWLWMTGTSRAPTRLITPAADHGNLKGADAADHAPAVDNGNIKGTNAADRPPAVDDGSRGGTETDPDSTPRISWEDKGKGVDLREYGPLMLGGSLLTGSFAQHIVQGFSDII
ncbi:hypothetical protein BU17DRAFT_70853 [Hysterangium stoloniferum]|nr:hypothetical protein BU17DRAFT_70853 [Hysterangium stoloniferum]